MCLLLLSMPESLYYHIKRTWNCFQLSVQPCIHGTVFRALFTGGIVAVQAVWDLSA